MIISKHCWPLGSKPTESGIGCAAMSDAKEAERFALIAIVCNSRAKGLIAEMGVEIRMPFNPVFCLGLVEIQDSHLS